jgi:hypothetical protein
MFIVILSCNYRHKRHNDCPLVYYEPLRSKVFIFTEQMPIYVGGDLAFMEYIRNIFSYPQQDTFQGFVNVEFVVAADDKIIGVRVKGKEITTYTPVELEIVKLLENTVGWKSGTCNGIKVPVLLSFSLRF